MIKISAALLFSSIVAVYSQEKTAAPSIKDSEPKVNSETVCVVEGNDAVAEEEVDVVGIATGDG